MEIFIETDTASVELFFNISPPELRNFSYRKTNVCIMCHRSVPPGIGTTVWHSSPPLCHSENADADRTGISCGVRKDENYRARSPSYRVDED